MREFTLIFIGWNVWNGFLFEILRIDCGSIDSSLIGFNLSKRFLYIDFLFTHWCVFDNTQMK